MFMCFFVCWMSEHSGGRVSEHRRGGHVFGARGGNPTVVLERTDESIGMGRTLLNVNEVVVC